MEKKIGFIGLGAMGKFMAENLLKDGFKAVLFDVNAAALAAFRDKAGVEIVSTAAGVGAAVSTVVTMLPDSPHVEEAVLGPQGLANTLKAGAIVVDMENKTYRHLRERCIGCGLCVLACDKQKALDMEPVPDYRLPYRSWFSLIAHAMPGALMTSWEVWRRRQS